MPASANRFGCAGAICLMIGCPHVSCATDDASSRPPLAPEQNLCAERAEPVAIGSAQWNGWGRDLDNTRYQPEPAIRATDIPKLALKWAYGYQGGAQSSQPTVVDGRLFIVSSRGRVYALDVKSGCTYWTYDAPAGSTAAMVIGELGLPKRAVLPKKLKRTLAHLDVIKAPSAAILGDDSGAVYALDAQKGTLLWRVQADSHPSARIVGAPVVYNDRVYVAVGSSEEKMAAQPGYACCTFRGSVVALDIASGRTVWKSYTVLEPPQPTAKSSAGVQQFGPAGAAVASAPTIDPQRNVLYVATGGSLPGVEQSSLTNAVVAFDLSDGKLRWVKQLTLSGEAAVSGFSSSPILRTLSSGNQVIMAGQMSGVMYGLDPDHGGDILWQVRLAQAAGSISSDGSGASSGSGGSVASSGSAGVSGSGGISGSAGVNGSGGISGSAGGGIAWGPAADHRSVYVALSGQLSQPGNATGSLTALDMKTGALRWTATAPRPACSWIGTDCWHAQSQAVSVIPGSAFSGSLDGHLRAYSTIDGKVLWDFDTAKSFQTENGVAAAGGPLDRGGATIVNGTVYVNSGNALLAFSVDGK